MEGDTYTLSFSRLHGAILPEPSTKLNRVFRRFLSSSGIHFYSFQKQNKLHKDRKLEEKESRNQLEIPCVHFRLQCSHGPYVNKANKHNDELTKLERITRTEIIVIIQCSQKCQTEVLWIVNETWGSSSVPGNTLKISPKWSSINQ